jgi:hypothetical protein
MIEYLRDNVGDHLLNLSREASGNRIDQLFLLNFGGGISRLCKKYEERIESTQHLFEGDN